jgi:GDP-4-dehydro-6-deoxy-D-mannose reductase
METVKNYVTGAAGFMGSHLIDFLTEKGHEVYGCYYGRINNLDYIENKENLSKVDVRNQGALLEDMCKCKPDFIYHLAAQSYPAVSWKEPTYTLETNVVGTANVFEVVKTLEINPTLLIASSSATYGYVNENEVPVKESKTRKPLHPYGVSKVASEMLAYQYHMNDGVDTFALRIFNTTGPRKIDDVCADFTKRVVEVEKGLSKEIKVGNLEARRSITDVRDEIRGFYLAMEKLDAGDILNISGDKVYCVEDFLNLAINYVSLTNPKIEVDENLLRPTDEPIIYGDSTAFREKTGWKQEILLEKTVQDMVDFWRRVL